MISDLEIKTLTVDLGTQKKKIKVAVQKTLSQLRSENKWCDIHFMFVDPDDVEIEPENEFDFTISDILNEQSMTIKMVPITTQTPQNDEEFAQMQKKIEQLEEQKKIFEEQQEQQKKDKIRLEEEQKKFFEEQQQKEKIRLEEESKKIFEEQKKIFEEQKKIFEEHQEQQKKEKIRLEEEQKKFFEEQQQKEKIRLEEEQKKFFEEQYKKEKIRLEEEQKKIFEEQQEQQQKEKIRLEEEQKKIFEEQKKIFEEQQEQQKKDKSRLEEEQKKFFEEQQQKEKIRLEEEQKKIFEEQKKIFEEQKKIFEEQQEQQKKEKIRLEEEQKKIFEEQQKKEKIRLEEEQKKIFEEQQKKEKIRLEEELEQIRKIKQQEEKELLEKNERKKQERKQKEEALERERQLEEQKALLKKKKEQEEYEKSLRIPIKGSELYEHNKNNLDIYLYPRYQAKDLSYLEQQNLKVIMVVGQTGSGKSTLLDAMVNYLTGVEFSYNFRYKLIDERQILNNKNNDQSISITDQVNQYYIKPQGKNRVNFPLLLVDTPGFMDTRGIHRDKQITEDIAKYFKTKIDQIHCVCLVSISSNARLTCSQKYVFNKVLEIFGKDIEENIANMFTFCDGGKVQVLQSLQNEKIPINYNYKFNNSALFSQTGDMFESMFWDMGIKSMDQFFKDVEVKFIPKSLSLTKEVLDQRRKLEHTVLNIRPRIDVGLSKLESARKELALLEKHQEEIEGNKNFTYQYKEEKFRKIDLPAGVHTTTCIKCNRTCHDNCFVKDDKQKAGCLAMSDGKCTVCPQKCDWSHHSNVPYIFEYYSHTEQRTSESLKKRFVDAKSKQAISDQVLLGLSRQFQAIQKEIYNDIETLHSSLKRLSDIALKPNPHTSKDLLELMIEQERQNKTPGYEERIKSLFEVKSQYEMLNQLTGPEKEKALESFFKSQETTFIALKKKEKERSCSIF